MSRRIPSVLIGAALCLAAGPGLGRFEGAAASPAAAAFPSAKVPADTPPQSIAGQLIRIDTPAAEASGVSSPVLNLALTAVRCAVTTGEIEMPPTLTLIDYSRPSIEPRLWVFDTATGQLLFSELVAHGRNTGDNMATRFSDTLNSRQSSVGLFVTDDTYTGSNGYSLRLDGLEPGFNGRARQRAIVMHGAPYVDRQMAVEQGRLGRSWGCPALREAIARDVIDTIRGGGVIFSYYPDAEWLEESRFLNGCGASDPVLATN